MNVFHEFKFLDLVSILHSFELETLREYRDLT